MSPLEPLDQEDEAQAPVPVGSLHLPPRLAQWEPQVVAAAQAHGVPESLIFAVMDHESRGGEALRELCGDWTARVGHWMHEPHVLVVTKLPDGWRAPPDTGEPWAIPEDGLGWGRGLMQLDFANAQRIDWRDPAKNIDLGAWMLAVCMAEFPKSPRSAVAAYNCGAGNVRRALLAGLDVDHYTTGRDYSADVMRRAAGFRREGAS